MTEPEPTRTPPTGVERAKVLKYLAGDLRQAEAIERGEPGAGCIQFRDDENAEQELARALKANAAEVALAKAWDDGPWPGCMPPETYATFTDPDEADASSD